MKGTMFGFLLGCGAAVAGAVVVARRTGDGKAAWHVLRGRPLVKGVRLVPPPLLHFADGASHVLVQDVTLASKHSANFLINGRVVEAGT